ncbi:MAG: protein kinase [Vicinamibacteraceae bacterium]|nr:protein kinase [Vicinamibacteraceae bacterium]
MPLAAGTRLGPYEILGLVGAGGMGEVYKARDTRLDRTVAIKVLAPAVSAGPERRARFEREAKTIASLNHPHICTLHDVGEHEGATFLVMEHLAGETLAARLRKGPLPVEQALAVATEVADGLAAAHRQGVVHRDLKPGNVMLTKSGVKLLDFGLAKLVGHGEQPAAAQLASASTHSAPLTGQGTILGTVQYMAPEQLEAKPADARSDLWALGAIVYETVTGRRAFEGTSTVSLIAAIFDHEPPPITSLQPLAPPALDQLVRQCLAKAPEDRPDTAHDVANDLRWIRESNGAAVTARAGRPRSRAVQVVVLATALVAAAAIGAAVMSWLRSDTVPGPAPRASPAPVARLQLAVRPAEELYGGEAAPTYSRTPAGSRTALAWMPDGRALVFVGRNGGVQQLYVRHLDEAEARPLEGTDGAHVPAVSPDGQWVAFWANGALSKVRVSDGAVTQVAGDIRFPPVGLAWDARGGLFYGRTREGRIWHIPAEGGEQAVTVLGEEELSHDLPSLLPGDGALLYTVRKRFWSWGDEEVVVQTLATGARKPVLRAATDARYVASGHLLFLRRGQLFGVPFDPVRMEVLGKEELVLDDGVAQGLAAGNTDDVTGAGQFAVAANGTLAWVPSPVLPYPDSALVSVDRRGHVTPIGAPVRAYTASVRLSPRDGRQMAAAARSLTEASVWVYDPGRGTLTPVARNGEASWPTWSPDGVRLAFAWLAGAGRSLAMQTMDDGATTSPRVLVTGDLTPSSFSPDGRELAAVLDVDDVVVLSIDGGRATVRPLLASADTERWPEFSPDGNWLAYGSDVTGRNEVYVQPYPGPGSRVQVSIDSGYAPAWHRNGRELFFLARIGTSRRFRMMVASFEPASPPRIGAPRPLFDLESDLLFLCNPVRCYDVSPDGQRFYVVQIPALPPLPAVTHVNVIQNWFEELRAKAPVK